MQTAIITALLADADVIALVDDRIFPLVREQGSAVPALVVTKISGGDDYTMTGPSGLREGRVQVDCYSHKALGAAMHWALVAVVRSTLSGLIGTFGNVRIQAAFLDSERDLFEADDARPLLRTSLDFTVWAGSAS